MNEIEIISQQNGNYMNNKYMYQFTKVAYQFGKLVYWFNKLIERFEYFMWTGHTGVLQAHTLLMISASFYPSPPQKVPW